MVMNRKKFLLFQLAKPADKSFSFLSFSSSVSSYGISLSPHFSLSFSYFIHSFSFFSISSRAALSKN